MPSASCPLTCSSIMILHKHGLGLDDDGWIGITENRVGKDPRLPSRWNPNDPNQPPSSQHLVAVLSACRRGGAGPSPVFSAPTLGLVSFALPYSEKLGRSSDYGTQISLSNVLDCRDCRDGRASTPSWRLAAGDPWRRPLRCTSAMHVCEAGGGLELPLKGF